MAEHTTSERPHPGAPHALPAHGFDVRFWGRGGQGVVTSAELLAMAAFAEDRFAQAIPSFGSERMGAPVMAFCRISRRPIRTREPVAEPRAVVVSDITLVHHVDLFEGLRDGGSILVNTTRPLLELGIDRLVPAGVSATVVPVAATELARRFVGRPLPNAALLGGLAALTEVVSLTSLGAAIRERFSGEVAEGNVAAATAAYDAVASGNGSRRRTGKPLAPTGS